MSRAGWRNLKWGDLATLEYGRALRGYHDACGDHPVFGTNGQIGWHDQPLFPSGGVIVGRKGAYRGIHFSAKAPWVIDTAFYLNMRDPATVDPLFAYYQLLTVDLDSIDSGSAIPSTSRPAFYAIPISLPPLDDQKRIVWALGAYDDLVENNTRRIQILEEMAQKIHREWFVEFRYPGHENVPLVESELGPMPEDWRVSTLGEVCLKVQAGGTPSRKEPSFWNGGHLDWYKTGELQDGFLLESDEKITQAAIAESSARLLDEGVILMAIYGSPTVGRLGVLTTTSACNQAALALVPNEQQIGRVFLYYQLKELRDYFNSIALGAAQQNISKAKVMETLLVVPPKNLMREYEQFGVPLFDLRRSLTKTVANLRATRDFLLPRLISGEIDVSDLNVDTPALVA